MSSNFEENLPEQSGRVVVVTGGNSGIGFETAVAFARKGARTVLACRDPRRAEGALEELGRKVPGAEACALPLDLADLDSIRGFAAELEKVSDRLDLLINNAGIMGLPKSATKDGFETHIGTNHIGHFALTLTLLPKLERAPGARVVTVSSITHSKGRIDPDDLDMEREYSAAAAYAGSKLANLLFAYELERRLRREGLGTRSLACHPGFAATQITKGTRLAKLAPWIADVLVWGNALVGQPAHMGAWPTLFAATAEVPGGSYVGPSQLFGTRGEPAVVRSSPASYDEALARRLWQVSEERARVTFARAADAAAGKRSAAG